MFVVSILDDGDERNFVATDIRISTDDIVIEAGGDRHLFRLIDVIDILPIGTIAPSVSRSPSFRSRRAS
ncbi:hypothetical protein [Rhizobium sp. Root708]|uniref:hypothetical protein n=1 Tax=Rhizobium sp. Root708 TaxID=1736592 RepID=UPI0012E362C7|nr:hypothetical protein [Rhizobium sp. Root708]